MSIVGYTALHYGRDYLAYAIRSIIDHIDEYHVLYTSVGSHGHRTDVPCPETRDELYAIAQQAAGDKLRWHDGEWPFEGAQRDSIHHYAPNADVIIVLDADEIWPSSEGGGYSRFDQVLALAKATNAQRVRMKMVHFWRSFNRAMLHDPAYPERIIFPKKPHSEATVSVWPIAHMGYAQRSEIVEYKQLTHGHRGEWRKDCDWFEDVFMANSQLDCHPVGSQYWYPEFVDPLQYMPEWMSEHPYFPLEVIP